MSLSRSPAALTTPELLSAAHPDITREHYLPVEAAHLSQRLYDELPAADRPHWESFERVLAATLHHAFHDRLSALMAAYAPFDPDRELPLPRNFNREELAHLQLQLFDDFRRLLARANFVQLAEEDIDEALEAASEWGVSLHVDTSAFEHLDVYARGDKVAERTRRSWWNFYRPRTVEIPVYERLAVIFRVRDARTMPCDAHGGLRPSHTLQVCDQRPVYIKLFKNVPKMDVDMLLPGTKVRMSWIDQGKIMLPTLSGLALAAIKIAKGAVVLTFVSVYGMLAFLGFVGGTLAYGLKSFFGYLQTKDKYHLHLTRSLYYQNLDNNAGVFARLLYEAEQQELREVLLALALLRKHTDRDGMTAAELDVEAEAWMDRQFGARVDFEVHDALAKLHDWGLAHCGGDMRWRAMPVEAACARLAEKWNACFPASRKRPQAGAA